MSEPRVLPHDDGVALVLPRAFAAQPAGRERAPIESWSSRTLPRLGLLGTPWRSHRARRRAAAIARLVATLVDLDEAAFDARRRVAGSRLRRDGLAGAALVEGIAITAEACRRVLGFAPYRGQLAAAAGLASGEVVEMDTGEGKTLSAFLAAATCGLAGRIVHVVTSNDYLAERDCAFLSPALARLGLTAGVVVAGDAPDKRRIAYRCDITFLSGKEVTFDYLRDGLVRGRDPRDRNLSAKLARALGQSDGLDTLQRALDVAIIDEIDSVLVDEAGTPLIISAEEDGEADAAVVEQALAIAAELEPGLHYRLSPHSILPELTRAGSAEITRRIAGEGPPWSIRLRREEMIAAALGARESLERDRDYLVRDGKVVIVDPHSGRTMADRQWGHDLHAMVEGKEGLEPSVRRKALASTSFQRFFRNYRHLAGMSGTVREVAGELATIYGLQLTRVPRRLPLRRSSVGRRVFATRDALWRVVGAEVEQRHGCGQPVMVAVRSVGEAARAAQELDRRGIVHRILSAAHDREEAEIVKEAGQRNAVTVVTNMAGRGTDIKLGPGIAELGGLAVLICERHESRRVDRQLMGRAARQGDPGEVAEFLSAEDAIVKAAPGPWRRLLARRMGRAMFGGLAFRSMQDRVERLQARRRFDLVRRDEHLAHMLAFAGGLD